MKRAIAIFLSTIMVMASLTACGKENSSGKNNGVNWVTTSGDSAFNANPNGSSTQKNETNSTATSENQSSSQVTSGAESGNSSVPSGNTSTGSKPGNTNSTVSSKPNNTSSNTQNNSPDEEEEEIKDISGDGITSNGVEKITSTTAIASEFSTPKFEKLTYQYSSSKKMCYSLRLPDDYDKNKKYPVLMFLHGIKQAGSNWNSLEHLAMLYRYNADIVNDAIVVAPQAPTVDLWQMTNDGTGVMAYSLLTNVIEKNYSVDMNRIYLIGLSMGGMGTWGMLQEHPDHFAAASPICGAGDPAKANKLKDVPIWCWHGTADTTVGYNWDGASPKMYDAIKKAGGNKIIFTKLQGEGHNAWDPAFKNREHISWLFSQVKGKHQSTSYSVVPYLTVVDADGNVVISEKDATDVSTRAGTGKVSNGRDLVLTLTKEGTQKLSKAYQNSGGKTFTIYFGNQKIVTFTATAKTTGRVLVIRDVFTESNYSTYSSKLLTTVGKK